MFGNVLATKGDHLLIIFAIENRNCYNICFYYIMYLFIAKFLGVHCAADACVMLYSSTHSANHSLCEHMGALFLCKTLINTQLNQEDYSKISYDHFGINIKSQKDSMVRHHKQAMYTLFSALFGHLALLFISFTRNLDYTGTKNEYCLYHDHS